MPAAIDLTGATWQLAAEDWKPANPLGTVGQAGSAITKDPVNVTLDGLKAWPDIPRARRRIGRRHLHDDGDDAGSWQPTSSAILSLGQVVDTVKLTVNGTEVPIDQISATADVGPYLKAGANTLVVRVATTLNNRLCDAVPSGRDRGHIQNYGLVGPVMLTPYGEAAVYVADRHAGDRRRHRAGDAVAHARRAGDVRRVHAGRRDGLRRDDDGERDLDRRGRDAGGDRPERRRRPAGWSTARSRLREPLQAGERRRVRAAEHDGRLPAGADQLQRAGAATTW